MPRPSQRHRHQTAVLWAKVGNDAAGEPLVSAPVELRVRWVQQRREAVDANGNTVALDASVTADRVIPVDSVMWLGELVDWTGSGELHQVRTQGVVPDLKGRATAYTAGLARFRDTLPTVKT